MRTVIGTLSTLFLLSTACASITPPPTPESARIQVDADRDAVAEAFIEEGLTLDELEENTIESAPVEIAPSVFVRYKATILNDRATLSGTIRNMQGEAVAGVGETEFPLHSEMEDENLSAAWERLERIAASLQD